MRSLMRLLVALDRASLEHKRPITLPLLREVLQHGPGNLNTPHEPRPLRPRQHPARRRLDFEWAQFLIGKGVVDREVQEAKNIQFYEQYKAGTLDIFEFLDFQLAPLARHPRRARRLAPRIHGHHIRPMMTARRARWSSSTSTPATCAPSSPPPTASSPARSPANSASRT
jgi:hypothetical protein